MNVILNCKFSIINSSMPKRYTPNDNWSQKAAQEGYRARSVYKLQEIDKRFHLICSGMSVLDLGAAPGSWCQYAVERVGPKGAVIGVDLKEIEPIEGAHCYQADMTDTTAIEQILKQHDCTQVDCILSDAAPNTSGIADVDQWKSIELAQAVIAIAKRYLTPRGTCVVKILRGADFQDFLVAQKQDWKKISCVQARASRDRSNEIFVVLSEAVKQ